MEAETNQRRILKRNKVRKQTFHNTKNYYVWMKLPIKVSIIVFIINLFRVDYKYFKISLLNNILQNKTYLYGRSINQKIYIC